MRGYADARKGFEDRYDLHLGHDLPELLEEATRRALTVEEARIVAVALRQREPWHMTPNAQ